MHVFQVGAGSGGIVVLDLVARDPRVTRVTLVEPDVYKLHNVHRHLFPPAAVGRLKADLAAEWVRERRPDVVFETVVADLTDASHATDFQRLAVSCDVGVCAVDNEAAKFAFDALMRGAGKPWTLGEVLSGGIGGWVHRFAPGGACYGCVAAHLRRTVTEEAPAPAPDYSAPGGPVAETTVPASRASISAIASLHAAISLDVLGGTPPLDFTSLLFTLAAVPEVFDAAYRPYRFAIPKAAACLVCAADPAPAGEELDVALDEALARLGDN